MVQTANLFALLGEGGDDDVVAPVVADVSVSKKAPVSAPSAVAKTATTDSARPNNDSKGNSNRNKNSKGPKVAESGAEAFENGNNGRSNFRENKEGRGGGSRGKDNGRGRGRGTQREGGADDGEQRQPRKREFDRHSVNGHQTEKRHGAGKANWGTAGETGTEADNDKNEPSSPKPESGDKAAEESEETETEMTLQQYEKLQEEKRLAFLSNVKAEVASVKAVDESAFAKMSLVKKDDLENDFLVANKKQTKKVEEIIKPKAPKPKEVLEVAFRVVDPNEQQAPRERSARGNRGSGRGDRSSKNTGGRGSNREALINIESDSAFPALAIK